MEKQQLDNLERLTPAELDPITTNDNFRNVTQQLLEGRITVPDWMEEMAEVVNEKVDIPGVPEALEDSIFRMGLKILGSILHGLLSGGTENSPTH